MFADLDDLGETPVRREAGNPETLLHQGLLERIVELVAMAVSLADLPLPIGPVGEGVLDAPFSVTCFCSGRRSTTGWGVPWSNSELLAAFNPQTFLEYSTIAICIPRQIPKKGT